MNKIKKMDLVHRSIFWNLSVRDPFFGSLVHRSIFFQEIHFLSGDPFSLKRSVFWISSRPSHHGSKFWISSIRRAACGCGHTHTRTHTHSGGQARGRSAGGRTAGGARTHGHTVTHTADGGRNFSQCYSQNLLFCSNRFFLF